MSTANTSRHFINAGTSAPVYWDHREGSKVAIKKVRVLNGDKKEFDREVDILSKMRHPNIIQYYGQEDEEGKEGEDCYSLILMEYAPGGTLTEAISRLNWVDKKRITVEIASGLSYLHSQGYIHRDIKGANILLTEHDEAKLCDFGLAKATTATMSVTSSSPLGTPGYIAPEINADEPKYSFKSDVFALGVVMQEMVQGDYVPPDYAALLHRCLDTDPEKRPTTEDIMAAFDQEPEDIDDFINFLKALQLEDGDTPSQRQVFKPATRLKLTDDAPKDVDAFLKTMQGRIETGDVEAMGILGLFYGSGQGGMPKDEIKASDLFFKAAAGGDTRSQRELAIMCIQGRTVLQDYVEVAKWSTQAAEGGDALMQFFEGWRYMEGAGVEKDQEKAMEWHLKSAEQGHVVAYLSLALMFSSGPEHLQNHEKASHWLLMAAQKGVPGAQYLLGLDYIRGDGVEKSDAKAVGYLRKAAEAGNLPAQCLLGVVLSKSDEFERDYAKAKEWLEKAAHRGDPSAQNQLGEMYLVGRGVERDVSKAIDWFQKTGSAEGGTLASDVSYNLGVAYLNDPEEYRDKAKAQACFLKAAENGYAAAQCCLGIMYLTGDGVDKDSTTGLKWLTLAAESGDITAQSNLGNMYMTGFCVEEDLYQALDWFVMAKAQGSPDAAFGIDHIRKLLLDRGV